MVGLIIIVLLFSVVAIVALYTTPQNTFQQIDPAALQNVIDAQNIQVNVAEEDWELTATNTAGEAVAPIEIEVANTIEAVEVEIDAR